MKACHQGMGSFQESRVLDGEFGRHKRGGHGSGMMVFPTHFQMSYRNDKIL